MNDGTRHLPRPRHSLRRRVTLSFVAATVITALALALSAYFITKTTEDEDALEKALAQSRFNLFLADSMLPRTPAAADYTRLVQALQIRGDFSTLVEAAAATYVSGPDVTRELVSSELATKVAQGRVGYQNISMAGQPTIAVGGQVRSAALVMYFFYPQGDRLANLVRLRNVLIVAGLVLGVLGALAGYLLARRLLGPIRGASKAAVLVSQGDLDIRLPVGSDEFGVLAASFNQMTDNLRSKMHDLEAGQARERRFVADVTHELRTPIAALTGEASLLRTRLETSPADYPEDISHLVVMVSADIGRLRELVDDLLEISRLDARAAETLMETVDMEPFMTQLIRVHGWDRDVELQIDGQTVRDTRPLPAEPVSDGESTEPNARYLAHTDKRRVERIVVNLVENALEHGAPPVVLSLRRIRGLEVVQAEDLLHSERVEVTVTDAGPGISPEHLSHIFDRFYKADPSRATGRGSGLGLAIARENARLLGGELTVKATPGEGASFVLTLPAACGLPPSEE